MLYRPPPRPQQDLRHYCRNPRCRCKLKLPTYNARDAFCCRGRYTGFYRSRCLVCEQSIARKNERRLVCNRPKCRGEFRRDRERFAGGRYPISSFAPKAPTNSIKSGVKSRPHPDRTWRIIAGPDVPEVNLQVPLDPGLTDRLKRARAELVEFDRKASRSASREALIKRHHPPVNVVGGYRFPSAPVVNLSPIEPAPVTVEAARLIATIGADLAISDFLKRTVPAAPRPAAKEKADAAPGADLHFQVAQKEVVDA